MARERAYAATEETRSRSVPPVLVRDQLERLLSSRDFACTEKRRRLLTYVVEETLAERGERLKGFAIATEVFDRSDDFDPQTDPVVRIEARRLRRDLDSYYAGPGRCDPVRISIPKGGYKAVFEFGAAPAPASANDPAPNVAEPATETGRADAEAVVASVARPGRIVLAVLVAAVVVAGLLGPRLLVSREPSAGTLDRPSVLVARFRPADGHERTALLAEGITHEFVSALLRFPDIDLYVLDGASPEDEVVSNRLLRERAIAYRLTGEVAAEDDTIRLTARLVDADTRRMIWSESYAREMTTANLARMRAALAGEVASVLGQPYGVLRGDLEARAIEHVPSALSSYHCVLRAYRYRRTFERASREAVRACLEAAVERDPDYAEAWAMLGWLRLDQGRFEATTEAAASTAYDAAFAAATRALAVDRDNVQALKALSSINHYRGNFDESERLAREALARNPNDPDTMAQLGWRLAVRGDFEEGTPYLRRALERSVRPPGWYFDLIAIDHLMRGEHGAMLATAERAAVDGSATGQAFVAIAHAHLGNAEAARAALARMAEASPGVAANPARYYRTHQATEAIVAELMRGLRLAGWRPTEERTPTR